MNFIIPDIIAGMSRYDLKLFSQGRVFLGWTSTKLGLCVLLKDHKAMKVVRLKHGAPRSGVKHSTTEPLRSQQTNSVDPDEMPQYVAFHKNLHCL